MMSSNLSDLTGCLLLATPGMQDPRFHKAVILICAHDKKGAMGLVINNEMTTVTTQEVLSELNEKQNIKVNANIAPNHFPVLSGGPVETSRGFLLHSTDHVWPDSVKINDLYSITGTLDALQDVVDGKGPAHMVFILGYAGWSQGQLDQELADGAWLIAKDAPYSLTFSKDTLNIWSNAFKNIGIDPGLLSAQTGRA